MALMHKSANASAAGGSRADAGGDDNSSGLPFSGRAFERFAYFTTLTENGGGLIDEDGVMKLYVSPVHPPIVLKAVGGHGGPPASKTADFCRADLEKMIDWAKRSAVVLVKHMLRELDRRFPPDPLVDALAVADVSHWRAIRASNKEEDYEHLLRAAPTIASAFATDLGFGMRFRLALLRNQAPAFQRLVLQRGFRERTSSAVDNNEGGEEEEEEEQQQQQQETLRDLQAAIAAASKPRCGTPTDELWRAVFGALPSQLAECSEWLRFVAMSYSIVLGTNDNERAHSRMKLLRTALRSKLRVEHLTAPLRVIFHPQRITPARAFARWVVGRINSSGMRS